MYVYVMPALENKLPEMDGRSLNRREGRSQAVLSLARAMEPGMMALRLRRCAVDMAELAQDAGSPAPDRIAAAKALVAIQAQMMEVIGWSKRPAAAGKGKPTAPMLDVSPGSPDLPDQDA